MLLRWRFVVIAYPGTAVCNPTGLAGPMKLVEYLGLSGKTMVLEPGLRIRFGGRRALGSVRTVSNGLTAGLSARLRPSRG
jgi:hypothetical protein